MSPPLDGRPPERDHARAEAAESSPRSHSEPRQRPQPPPYRSGGAATAAAKAGWPDRTTSEIAFVAAGLRALDEAARRRARRVRLEPWDPLAAIVQGIVG